MPNQTLVGTARSMPPYSSPLASDYRMPSNKFINWYKQFRNTGDICPVRLGMARPEVESILGKPDLKGGKSRKQILPLIWKYNELEFNFGPRLEDGLLLIYMETEDGITIVSISSDLPDIR